MKLISLIGNDPLKVLLPLTQLTNMIDGAYFLVTEANYSMARRLQDWIFFTEYDPEDPGRPPSTEIIVFTAEASYAEIFNKIREIMDLEYRGNEEVAFNYDGGSRLMQRVARFAAKEMLAPQLCVDTRLFKMRLSCMSWDHKTFVNHNLPCTPPQFSLQSLLRLYGLRFTQNIQKNSSAGFRYERKIYDAFLAAKEAGIFSDVERNLVFTWDAAATKKNEIDIVVLRNGVIGFISIKSGRGLRRPATFSAEYKKMIQRYPDSIAGKPCLKMLICKEEIASDRFIKMIANEIAAIDDVQTDSQLQLAVDLAAAGCGHIAKTGHPLPFDFYHRFINKQFGKWGNEIGKMRKRH